MSISFILLFRVVLYMWKQILFVKTDPLLFAIGESKTILLLGETDHFVLDHMKQIPWWKLV